MPPNRHLTRQPPAHGLFSAHLSWLPDLPHEMARPSFNHKRGTTADMAPVSCLHAKGHSRQGKVLWDETFNKTGQLYLGLDLTSRIAISQTDTAATLTRRFGLLGPVQPPGNKTTKGGANVDTHCFSPVLGQWAAAFGLQPFICTRFRLNLSLGNC